MTGGMVAKLEEISRVVGAGVRAVHIVNGNQRNALLSEIFGDQRQRHDGGRRRERRRDAVRAAAASSSAWRSSSPSRASRDRKAGWPTASPRSAPKPASTPRARAATSGRAAARDRSCLLLNSHLDTVPPSKDGRADPWMPRVAGRPAHRPRCERCESVGRGDARGVPDGAAHRHAAASSSPRRATRKPAARGWRSSRRTWPSTPRSSGSRTDSPSRSAQKGLLKLKLTARGRARPRGAAAARRERDRARGEGRARDRRPRASTSRTRGWAADGRGDDDPRAASSRTSCRTAAR